MGGIHLSRRRLLTGAGLAAVGVGLAACGGKGDDAAPGQGPATTTPANGQGGGQGAEAVLRRKIASLLVVGFREPSVSQGDWVMRAITEQGLGGVILFDRDQLTGAARNIVSRDQVRSLIQALKAANPRLIVSIDQEGGRISRLNPANGFPAFPSQAEVGAANSPGGTTRTWARDLAQTLASVGFTFNFAPVVDLNVNPTNPAVGELGRSFSADPQVVVAHASEEVRQRARSTSLDGNEYEQAVTHARRGLAIHRQTEHRLGQAHAHAALARTLHATGDTAAAHAHQRTACELFRELGAPAAAAFLSGQGR
jgi:beta-N-acetylhexosaminidase